MTIDEGVDDVRSTRSVGEERVGTEPPPLGAVRTELLATGEPVPTIDPLCHAGRQEDGMSLPVSA